MPTPPCAPAPSAKASARNANGAAVTGAEELFAPFAGANAILIALSGGPDSMALLWLAARWAGEPGRPRLEAATVDHGMRAASAEEARAAGRAAAALGVPHHLLKWSGPKPSTRIQERARDARYALLDACAGVIGADVLLTAHHADDQAETILFRMVRGSGIAGLAGMAAISTRNGLIHGRPLLGLTKEELLAVCAGAGLDYSNDPSNADPRFARTGLRRLSGLLAAEGLGREQFLRLGARAARNEAGMDFLARRMLASLAAVAGEGNFQVRLGSMRDAPAEWLLRILLEQTRRLAPAMRRPRLDRAEALAERLAAALRAGTPVTGTLGGALVRLDGAGALSIRAELPRKAANRAAGVHVNVNISDSASETWLPSLGKGDHDA